MLHVIEEVDQLDSADHKAAEEAVKAANNSHEAEEALKKEEYLTDKVFERKVMDTQISPIPQVDITVDQNYSDEKAHFDMQVESPWKEF